jgi:hypothetical protein
MKNNLVEDMKIKMEVILQIKLARITFRINNIMKLTKQKMAKLHNIKKQEDQFEKI